MIIKNNTKSWKTLIKSYVIAFVILLLLAIGANFLPTIAFAQTDTSEEALLSTEKGDPVETNYTVEKVVADLFGDDAKIAYGEFLYNFDQSSDYVYVEFKNTGYAVFLKETMELLEFSPTGKLCYPEIMSFKYYGGPGSYYYKRNNYFVDAMTNEQFYVSETKAYAYASDIRETLKYNYNMRKEKQNIQFDYSFAQNDMSQSQQGKTESLENCASVNSSPPYDRNNLIHMDMGTFIPNYRYFLSDPMFGVNSTGTCSAVATQLLLSYHNYYSDRRIIADKYLNGDDCLNAEDNPNYCSDPMKMSRETLGTRGSKEDGSDDPNSYFHYVVSKIPAYSSIDKVKSGINSILQERQAETNGGLSYTIDMRKGSYSYAVNSNYVVPILDSGKPLYLVLAKSLGGTNHAIVAYGYNQYQYADSQGKYFGYITHFGWAYDSDKNEKYSDVWVNSMWTYGYLSLNINHLHRYYQHQNEYRCSLCKHRTDASIYMGLDDRYYEITANIPQNNYAYKDFYVVFSHEGQKLFQTFGKKSVKMSLYDSQYNLLVHDEQNNGYGLNPFFYYNVSADVVYYLRIALKSETDSGRVKIGVTPASEVYDNYAAIDNLTTDSSCTLTYSPTRFTTKVLTFTAQSAGKYTFETHYVGAFAATCLYLVDPASPNECDFDCDSGEEELQGYLRRTLAANKKYFIVVSLYNPSSTECDRIKLTIKKVS